MNESASLLLMEYPMNVWKQSETKHNELLHLNGGACLARNVQCCVTWHVTVSVLLVLFCRNARWRCRRESSSCRTFWWFPCRECWSITYYSRQERTARGQISTLQLSSSTYVASIPEKQQEHVAAQRTAREQCKRHNVYARRGQGRLPCSATLASFPVTIIALY